MACSRVRGARRSTLGRGCWGLFARSAGVLQRTLSGERACDGQPQAPYTPAPPKFAVPIAATTCACIPAEFPGEEMKVELRAVAEQTGYEPAKWQTAFRVRGDV